MGTGPRIGRPRGGCLRCGCLRCGRRSAGGRLLCGRLLRCGLLHCGRLRCGRLRCGLQGLGTQLRASAQRDGWEGPDEKRDARRCRRRRLLLIPANIIKCQLVRTRYR